MRDEKGEWFEEILRRRLDTLTEKKEDWTRMILINVDGDVVVRIR